VVQWPTLRRHQFFDLWHADCFPTELPDVGCCLRLRSVWRLLHLLTDRLSRNNLRRRQYPKLQKHSVAEISDHRRSLPGGTPLWQFGGYGENNASGGAYQFGVGADIATRGKDVLSVDAIYSHVKVPWRLRLRQEANNAFGMPIAPFLPQTLTATISDNTAAMFVAKYTTGPLKLYAGYEYFRFTAPSDPQTGFSDIAGNLLCLDCQAINNTNINNADFGVNSLGNRVLQIMWTGAKYAVTDDLDVIGAYYHQNRFSAPRLESPPSAPATRMRNAPGRTMRFLPQWIGDFRPTGIFILA
jgi:hypothetical protein